MSLKSRSYCAGGSLGIRGESNATSFLRQKETEFVVSDHFQPQPRVLRLDLSAANSEPPVPILRVRAEHQSHGKPRCIRVFTSVAPRPVTDWPEVLPAEAIPKGFEERDFSDCLLNNLEKEIVAGVANDPDVKKTTVDTASIRTVGEAMEFFESILPEEFANDTSSKED